MMTEENTITRTDAQNMGMGSGHQGFVGRYKITPRGIEDLHGDRWCEGTQYTIHPFRSTSEQFFTHCLDMLIDRAPADIFHQLQNVERKAFYVPMAKAGKWLVCLHSQLPELSYEFLHQGTCSQDDVTQLFGQAEVFDPATVNPQQTEFLSIWLSLADVSYVASMAGQKYDMASNPQVVFVPVHYLSFDYQGKHYVIMCYGDESMSQLTYRELPADDVLTGQKLLYNRPWISISILFALLLIVVMVVIVVCTKLWSTLSWFVLYKLVVFAIPIFIVYCIAWFVLRLIGVILSYTMLFAERFCSKLWQRHVIRKNLETKRQALAERFGGHSVTFPEVNSYQIDTTEIETRFQEMLDRFSGIRAIDKIDKM